jgi:pimeloyl-ACP methyl ester carboxylesterase
MPRLLCNRGRADKGGRTSRPYSSRGFGRKPAKRRDGRSLKESNIRFEFLDLGSIRLRVASAGDPAKPLIICLHGFPEYWAGWEDVMERLSGDFHVVAPDQRGYNLSAKPKGVEQYRVKHMVADLAGLADRLSPGRPFVLAGHDWGASVAYAYAFSHPHRVSRLVIANGPHPSTFQRAIIEDPEQRAASQYMNRLREPGMEERLADDDFARLARMFSGFSATDWATPTMQQRYREAWGQEGALEAMLNWYRASPVVVPAAGETPSAVPILALPDETFLVRMPHLLLWGEADTALRPSCIEGLDRFAPKLTVTKLAGAGHWILHEKPDEIAAAMRAFLG